MQTDRVPDAAQRKELSQKAKRLWSSCSDSGEWYDKGDKASHPPNQHNAAMAHELSEWARNPDTEGQPIPDEFA